MPRKIKQEDISEAWHVYEQIQGVPTVTREEATKGVHKLLRMAGIPTRHHPTIRFVSGRNRTHWPGGTSNNVLNINLTKCNILDSTNVWRDIATACAWRKKGDYDYALNLRMTKRICEGNWLVLGPPVKPPKPKVPLTKEQIRLQKVANLEARKLRWQGKQQRAVNAIRKINRSIVALRRHIA